jgi:hypothetical protein
LPIFWRVSTPVCLDNVVERSCRSTTDRRELT